ncbi:hypothetical protein JCM8097_002953 [Rhodosporidiobolus ruineniae]
MPTEFTTTDHGVTRIVKVDPNEALEKPRDPNTFLLLSGVNHSLFEWRDPVQFACADSKKPHRYGTATLADIEERVTKLGESLGVKVVCAQTDFEGELCQLIHYSRCLGGVVMNPGAFAHYSYALHDAIDACDSPVVEIHISNNYNRPEEWRPKSVTAPKCKGILAGCRIQGYEVQDFAPTILPLLNVDPPEPD